MLTLLVLTLLYFLPSILARNKRSFVPIFLLNLFLGWTLVGWVIALVWALSEPEPVAYAAAPPRFCCACGTPTPARQCPHCGKLWAA
ncbi:MAG TPA: superinfection immunity protein [Terriglobales bacterium]|nr:superinfection immunity protein [Terriglobales bacterium]